MKAVLERYSHDAWRDAVRRGLQSAAAALLALAAVRAVGLDQEFLALVGAVLILHPSVGGTLGAAWSRVVATVLGSAVGLVALWLLPPGWETMGALAISLFVVGVLTGLGHEVSYAAVAVVGLALAPAAAGLHVASERALGLILGAGAGVIVSFVLWPDRAESRFERHLRAALRATADRLGDAVEATLEEGREAAPLEHVSAWHKAIQNAEEAAEVAKLVDREGMRRRLEAARRLYHSLVILDRAAEGAAPLRGAEQLSGEVEELRKETCAVLTALAEGRRADEAAMAEIDETLGRLREAMLEDDPQSDLHPGRTTVAFGLREVRRTLARLIEVSRR